MNDDVTALLTAFRGRAPAADETMQARIYERATRTNVRSFHPSRRLLASSFASVLCVALLVATLVGAFGASKVSIVDRAIAALGAGPTIHLVFASNADVERMDIRTGAIKRLTSGVEVWSDPKLGTRWVSTVDGKPLQTLIAPKAQASAAFARWQPYVTGYRANLTNGTFHILGNGVLNGVPVTWIAGPPSTMFENGKQRTSVTEVALSRVTYKPLYFRQRTNGAITPDSGTRVVEAETLPRNPALFRPPTRTLGTGLAISYTPGSGAIPITLREARAAMNPDPVVPTKRIAGLQLKVTAAPDYIAPPSNSYHDQLTGIQFYYGQLDSYRAPNYAGRYISITEFARANTVVQFNGLQLFPTNAAIITATPGMAIATLHTHGLYIIVQAGTKTEARTAALAISR